MLKLGIKAADYYLDSQCQRCVSLCLVVRSSLFTSGADSEPIFYNEGLHLLRGSVTSSNHMAGSLLFLLRRPSRSRISATTSVVPQLTPTHDFSSIWLGEPACCIFPTEQTGNNAHLETGHHRGSNPRPLD